MTLDQLVRASELIADIWRRTLPDGREATVELNLFNARIVVGDGWFSVDDGW
ncbi:MAG TPA: hypothetical protein VK752_05355 [Bryobacteraceae bacterium]|nr:hypothetical protein [Bryobacteraceae bacterium]